MSIFNKVTKSFQWGDKTVVMETGEIARQASGAVLVNIDDTAVLATVVGSKQDPRQLLQARGQAQRVGDADQPPDLSPDPPAVPRGLLQRGACGHPHHLAEPRSGR